MLNRLLVVCTVLFISACGKREIDLLVYHATIYAVDSSFSTFSAMAIKDGKVLEMGDSSLLKKYNAKEKLNAKNQFIYPGFHDAHCHFSGYAMDKLKLDLHTCTSLHDIVEACKVYSSTKKTNFIYGRQWNESNFLVKEKMTKTLLDEAFPNTPVFLLRVDGHAALCNKALLNRSGITNKTKIEGGEIEVINGECTGLVFDNAMRKIQQFIPEINVVEAEENFAETEQEFFALGITSFTDCMVENNWMPDDLVLMGEIERD